MSANIHLIIISKSGDVTFLNRVQAYNLSTDTATVLYPTNSQYETTLLISQNALKLDPNWYNLIIYDWAYSILPTNTDIQNVIDAMIGLDQNVNPWSVGYLGKWMDTCNKYNNFTDTGKFDFVNGTEPVGFHAVLLTQDMSQKLQTKLSSTSTVYYSINYALQDIGIDDSTVQYIAVSPNLFTYDPLYNKVDVSKVYAVKSNECVGTTTEVTPPSDNDLTLFWILLLVIGVALSIWFVITTQKESSEIKVKQYTESIRI